MDNPSLSHLFNRPMSGRQLRSALKQVGANFFPEPDAGKHVSLTRKRATVEQSLYSSMALASCGYAFQWSRWNAEVSTGKVVVQAAEGDLTEEAKERVKKRERERERRATLMLAEEGEGVEGEGDGVEGGSGDGGGDDDDGTACMESDASCELGKVRITS